MTEMMVPFRGFFSRSLSIKDNTVKVEDQAEDVVRRRSGEM